MGELGERVAAGTFALILSHAAAARAEPAPVRIEYAAPAGCPDEAAFLEQVRRRTTRARLAGAGELARTVRVTIDRSPERTLGRLEFVDVDGRRVLREMSGEDCSEVASGIALVTALAIDARASGEVAEPPGPALAPPASLPATAPRQHPVAVPPPAQATETSSGGWRWDAGIGLLTTSAVGPELLYGLGAFVAAGPEGDPRGVRLTLAHLEGPTVAADRGEATFRLSMARLEGCPLAWRPAEALAVLPCAAFDAGMVAAEGGGARVTNPETARVFWAAVSAIGRLQVALQDFLLFEAQAELGAPLTRERFHFERPDGFVHEVDPVRWGLGAGVGFRFE